MIINIIRLSNICINLLIGGDIPTNCLDVIVNFYFLLQINWISSVKAIQFVEKSENTSSNPMNL